MATEIAPVLGEQIGIVRPLVDVDAAVRAFNEYQNLKQKLRGDGDFVGFKDRNGNTKEAPTKQWRSKLTRFFGLSLDVVKEEMETLQDGSFVIKATAKATAPNGLYVYGDGACWSKTKESVSGRGDLYHNTRSHAITRAKNRAVFELVGFGEVSAEEIEQGDEESNGNGHRPPAKQSPPATEKQRGKLFAVAKEKGFSPDDVSLIVRAKYKKGVSDLTVAEASDAIDGFTNAPVEKLQAALLAIKAKAEAAEQTSLLEGHSDA